MQTRIFFFVLFRLIYYLELLTNDLRLFGEGKPLTLHLLREKRLMHLSPML
jgi:hypothetical protein